MPTFVSIESPKLGSAVQLNNGDNTTVVSVENSTFGSVAQVNKNEIVNVYHLSNTDIQSYYNEISRQNAEDAQTAQLAAEVAQSAAETAETNAKASELDAEAAQAAAKTAQSKAETAQSNAETARDASQAAQGLAETAQASAELAESNAKASELDAEAAQVAAETAQSKAETAQSLSETAQASAELAETNAETARDASQVAQAAAELAESNAKASELDAEAAATAAQTAQSLAETAQAGAETAETNAETAQSLSEAAQAAAEIAETNAEIAEVGSISARDGSVTAQLAAESARNAAQTARTGAETAEANAQASASGATSAKVAAQAAQANAETAQSAAETAEANAQVSASNAAASAASAATDADRAERAAETAVNTLSAKGDWDASQGVYPTPTPNSADFYQISVAGTMSGTQGSMEASVGDQLYWHVDKSVWYKIDNTDHILSVNGKEGAVVLDHTDVGALGATQNAVSASKWQNARTLTLAGDATGAVSIDGSSNVTLTVDVVNDSHTHDGRYHTKTEADSRFANVSGDTFNGNVAISKGGAKLVLTESDYSTNNSGIDFKTATANQNLEMIHEVSDSKINTTGGNGQALIVRQTSGSAQAGLEVEGEIFARANQRVFHDAYHPNADKWTTARTLTLSGDVSGSVSWDGSANATLNATVANDSHSHSQLSGSFVSRTASQINHYGESVVLLAPMYDGTNISSSRLDGVLSLYRGGTAQSNSTVSINLSYHSAYNTSRVGYYYNANYGRSTQFISCYYNGVKYFALRIYNNAQDNVIYWKGTSTVSDSVLLTVINTIGDGSSAGAGIIQNAEIYNSMEEVRPNIPALNGNGYWHISDSGFIGNASTASKWETARTLTVGNTGKTVDGSGDVSWSLSEIGALPLTGGTLTGNTELAVGTKLYIGGGATSYLTDNGTQHTPLLSGSGNVYIKANNDDNGTSEYVQIHAGADTVGLRVATNTLTYKGNNVFRDDYHPNADKWTTARTLTLSGDVTGSVSFDGSANATITTVVANDSHTHSRLVPLHANWNTQTDEFRTGSTSSVAGAPTSSYINWIQWGHNGGSKFRHTLYSYADSTALSQLWYAYKNNTSNTTSAATASRIFMDNYHPNADKWTTARTLSLSGDASGSVSWDGSANATLSVTVANDSHTHDGRYYTESESNSRFVQNSEVASTATWAGIINKYLAKVTSAGVLEVGRYIDFHTNNSTADYDVRLDCNSSGNLSVVGGTLNGSFVGSLSGNASSASKWATARNFTIGSSTQSVNGSANMTFSHEAMAVGRWTKETINLSAYSTSNWFAVYLRSGSSTVSQRVNFYINGGSGSGGDPYTQTFLTGYAQASGWSALRPGIELNYYPYDPAKSTIHSIWRGTQNMQGVVVYLRGGFSYSIAHDGAATVYTSTTTISGAEFPSNVSNPASGGTNRTNMRTFLNGARGTHFYEPISANLIGNVTGNVSSTPLTSSNSANSYSIASQGAGVYAVLWSQSGQSNYSTILIWDGSAATLNGDYGNGLVPAINTSGTIYSAASTNWIPKRVVKIG
ncbi:hypothetical protein HJ044_04855 [Vibrio parahaemolyticus]|nr:hypothetical protein [Vibrio parahaemolyticus]